MALTVIPAPPEGDGNLKARIDRALARGGFGPWETSFLQDIRARLGSSRPRLTEKQFRKLHDVLSRSHVSRQPYPYRDRGRRRNRMPWPLRSFGYGRGYRLRRGLTLMLVLFLITGLHQMFPGLTLVHEQAAVSVSGAPAPSQPGQGTVAGGIRVIDGDTVAVGGEHFRLVGLNTPETFEPRCAAELELGTRAKDRLLQLLSSGSTALVKVPCACPPGTEGTKQCNFGRSCGVLSVNGRDVADTLVAEGLAVAFHCGTTSCPRLPKPWCS